MPYVDHVFERLSRLRGSRLTGTRRASGRRCEMIWEMRGCTTVGVRAERALWRTVVTS